MESKTKVGIGITATSTVIVATAMVLMSLGGPVLGSPIVTVNESGIYHIGDTMIVSISCNPNGKWVKGWECKLNFNKNVVQATAVTEGNFFKPPYTTFFNPGIINNTQGKIINIYNLVVGSGNVTANKYLFNVTFTVIGYGYSNISLSNLGLVNETQYITEVTLNNASLFVYSPYDLDNNKIVNLQDILSVSNHYGETGTPGWIIQDVNKDGQIRILDLVLVATHWGPY
jgi:hypothetical protein